MTKTLPTILARLFLSILTVSAFGVSGRSLTDAANAASLGLGKVTAVHAGRSGQVILIEEEHTSRVGQVEIAHMLVRLRNSNGLRVIGLEGFTAAKLQPKWTTRMSSRDRLRVASRLLGEGEISSAEFIASAFDDVTVVGIDSSVDYKVDLPKRASISRVTYLMLISQTSLKPAELDKVQSLLKQEKIDEAIEFSISSDPWTKNVYRDLTKPAGNTSTELSLQQLDLIEMEVTKRGIAIPNPLSKDFQNYKEFLRAASRRSDYMVDEITRLVSAASISPVAVIIGAGHTNRVVALLRKKDVAVAILRPNALERRSQGELRRDEISSYGRKLDRKSVDVLGLGALVGGQKKQPPVSEEVWLARKATIYQATLSVVDNILVAASQPPYKIDSLPMGYRVDFSKLSRNGDEIVFPIEYDAESGKRQTVWVRAAYSKNLAVRNSNTELVEARISALLLEAGGGGRDGGKPPPNTGIRRAEGGSDPKKSSKVDTNAKRPSEDARHIAEGIYASFANDKATLEKHAVLESDKL